MASELNLEDCWKTVLGEVEVELGKGNFGIYFKNSGLLSLENGIARLGFRNKGVADQVNGRYYSLLQTALQKITKIDRLSLVFEAVAAQNLEEPLEETGPLFTQAQEEKSDLQAAVKKSNLRPDFTFEDFCVSTSNQLAFAAATAVAKTPGKNYNPLFLWGGVGIGKTHLMQAIGHEILRKNSKAKVIYAPGEQFTNEIIEGIRNKNTSDFKNKYRSASALLIDDIQFLSGKDTAQEEFFHTFNAIQQNEGQIVITSDRKPADIKDLADRLRSRFEGGMVADISTPDSELKTAVCLLKARKRGLNISNSIASLIAGNVDNIRSLEGALQRISGEADARKIPITEDLVTKILKLPDSEDKKKKPRVDARIVLDEVCTYFELPIKLIKGEKRDKPIAVPRQILMYLLKKNTGMTLQEIADYLGGRDHTTIMHGVKKIEKLFLDPRIKRDVDELEKRLWITSGYSGG